ncbi:MAG TPA: hypothetical protein VHW69_08315 [Rhizomicrobium sp.]|jgi:hypothetical protein|nr:hypothetical protein [Rhizomicrobium sp.]
MLPRLGWIVVPGLMALLGLGLLFTALSHYGRGRPARGTAHTAVGAPLTIIGVAAALLGINAQTFARLSREGPVADVWIMAADPAKSLYTVRVTRLDGPKLSQDCLVQGDEWDIGARVQKWKPWANVLGLNATYTLGQITNRYRTAARGNGKPITACDLKGSPSAMSRWLPQAWLAWLAYHSYTEDLRFGSAVFMPLADGAAYRVLITQSGLNAEPSNPIARRANAARDRS